MHPLPIKWNLKIDRGYNYKEKIYYAMKAMRYVIKKYFDHLTNM